MTPRKPGFLLVARFGETGPPLSGGHGPTYPASIEGRGPATINPLTQGHEVASHPVDGLSATQFICAVGSILGVVGKTR